MASFRRASSGAGRQGQAVLLLAVALLLAPWTQLRPPCDPRPAATRLAVAQGEASSPEQLAASEAATASEFDAFEDALSLSAQSSGGRGRSTKGGTGKATFMDADKLRLLQQGMLYIGGSPDVFPTCRFKHGLSWRPGKKRSRRKPDCNAFVPSRPRDQQDCSTCVTEAIATAIQMSVAATLQEPADNWEVSSQSLYYCSKGGRTCRTGWDIQEALNFLIDEDATLIRPATCLSSITQFNITDASTDLWKGVCDEARSAMANCDKANPTGMSLRCSYKSIGTFWQMQRHIRRHGAVITRIRIPSDFEDQFGANASLYHGEAFKPYRYNDTARGLYGHAALIVGYNNTDRTWTVLNSWGDSSTRPNRTGVTKDGLYKIQMGLLAIGTPDLTYGVECEPAPDSKWILRRDPHQTRSWEEPKPLNVAPGNDPQDLDASCYVYRFSSEDSVSSIADHFGINMTSFVRDNERLFPEHTVVYSFVGKMQLPELQLVLDAANAALKGSSLQAFARCMFYGPSENPTEVQLNCTTSAADCMSMGVNGTVGCKLVYSAANMTDMLPSGTELRICGIANAAFYHVARFDDIAASQRRALRAILRALGKSTPVPENYCEWDMAPHLTVFGCTGKNKWVASLELQDPAAQGLLDQINSTTRKATPTIINDTLLQPLLQLKGLKELRLKWFDGLLPPQLGALGRLQGVVVWYYCAWGGLPANWLDGWKDIASLDVGPSDASRTPDQFADHACGISGSVPEQWSIAVGSPSLTRLVLAGNLLTGELPPLTNMSALEELDFSGNRFRSWLPRSWGQNLAGAVSINVAGNIALTGLVPREWSKLATINSILTLDNTGLQGCMLQEFQAARAVSYTSTNITGYCSTPTDERVRRERMQAAAMTSIFTKLFPDKDAGNAIARAAGFFGNLDWFTFMLDWVASEGLEARRYSTFSFGAELVKVGLGWDTADGIVYVTDIFVSGAALDLTHLSGLVSKLPGLETLDIALCTPGDGPGAARLPNDLGQRAKRLKEFRITESGLFGGLPGSSWSRWSTLTVLDLSGNMLRGTLPPSWGRLTSLQRLSLPFNELSGPLPPEWAGMESLQLLAVNNNRLSGPLPPSWKKMRSLLPTAKPGWTLSLHTNQGINGSLPPEWGDPGSSIPDGIIISVGATGLTGTIPPSYKRFTALYLEYEWKYGKITGCMPPGVDAGGQWLPPCSTGEQDAVKKLQKLLAGTYGSSSALEGWLSPSQGDTTFHCRNKTGITCDADDLVVKVDLLALRLTVYAVTRLSVASLFDALSGLPNLQTLVASSVGLEGPLPPLLAANGSVSLNKLRAINLSGNPEITGQLPASWRALQDLQALDVSGCSGISGSFPDDWAALQSLKVLRAANTGISGRLPPLYGLLASLEELDVSGARLEGDPVPPAWVDVSRMEAAAAASGLQGAAPLLAAQTAAAAVVGAAAVSTDVTSSQSTGQSATTSGARPVVLLTRLKTLRLAGNHFSGSLLPELSELRSLRALDLSTANGDGNITGVLPLEWAAMSKLQDLSLSGQKLSGGLPLQWSALSQLVALDLARNRLSGPLPAMWIGMKKLRKLDLSGNTALAGQLPSSWLQLGWCGTVVLLSGTGVTGC